MCVATVSYDHVCNREHIGFNGSLCKLVCQKSQSHCPSSLPCVFLVICLVCMLTLQTYICLCILDSHTYTKPVDLKSFIPLQLFSEISDLCMRVCDTATFFKIAP